MVFKDYGATRGGSGSAVLDHPSQISTTSLMETAERPAVRPRRLDDMRSSSPADSTPTEGISTEMTSELLERTSDRVAVSEDNGRVRFQPTFSKAEAEKVNDLERLMPTARNKNDVFRLSVQIAHYFLTKQAEGNVKIALIRGNDVEAVQLFV